MKKTRILIFAALMAALTYVGTTIIKFPTPTMGYVHPGDAFVLLSGALLGPGIGGLAAGIGSALSDLLGGYFIYVPATFLIKFITAAVAGVLVQFIEKLIRSHNKEDGKNTLSLGNQTAAILIGGVFGEFFMVLGYFLFEIFLLAYSEAGSFTVESLSAGIAASAAGIPFNLVQATVGVVLAAILYPILRNISKKTLEGN